MRAVFVLLCLLSAVAPAKTFTGGPDAAVVIELYTSEGCSSCPPDERDPGRAR